MLLLRRRRHRSRSGASSLFIAAIARRRSAAMSACRRRRLCPRSRSVVVASSIAILGAGCCMAYAVPRASAAFRGGDTCFVARSCNLHECCKPSAALRVGHMIGRSWCSVAVAPWCTAVSQRQCALSSQRSSAGAVCELAGSPHSLQYVCGPFHFVSCCGPLHGLRCPGDFGHLPHATMPSLCPATGGCCGT